jgi:F-type H+-transporting ATPase subunit delta
VRDTTAAARYAKALFNVTEKRGETDRALEDLHGLVPVLGWGSETGRHLASPQLRLLDKREALKKSLEGRVLPLVAIFVDLLLRKKRLREYDVVVTEFEALVEHARGIQRAHVVSAVPLDAAEEARLLKVLEGYTKKKVKLTSEVDGALMGGALVRIGDRVVDRSVRTLLDSIEHQLREVSV